MQEADYMAWQCAPSVPLVYVTHLGSGELVVFARSRLYGMAMLSLFSHGSFATRRISSRRTRHTHTVPTGTNIYHKPVLGPDTRVPALKAMSRRDATLNHQRGPVRDQDWLESVVRSGPFTVHDYGAGLVRGFGGEVRGAVPAFKGQGVGGDKEVVEGCVAVDGLDDGGGRPGTEANGLERVGGGEREWREHCIGGVFDVLEEVEVRFGITVDWRRVFWSWVVGCWTQSCC